MKARKAPATLASARARLDALEAELTEFLERRCDRCGRALHPRAVACYGCQVDHLRAGHVRPPTGPRATAADVRVALDAVRGGRRTP